MKLALLNMNYDPHQTTGGSTHVRQFVNHMLARNHEIWSFGGIREPGTHVFSTNLLRRNLQFREIELYYHRMEGRFPQSLEICLQTRNLAARGKPHVLEWNTVPEFRRLMGDSPQAVESLCEEFRQAAPRIALNICVSQKIAERIAALGMRNCVVVPNGSDPEHFSPEIPPCPRMQSYRDSFNVVLLGSLDLDWHDFSYLQDLATETGRLTGNGVLFHLIGSGLRDCHEMPANVLYHGAASYGQLPAWLSGMDVGLLIYEGEIPAFGSPLKLFDYMAAGVAILSTPQPQVEEILGEAEVSGGVMQGNDPLEMASAIAKLFENRVLSRAQGASLRQLLIEKYTWIHNVRRIEEEIMKLTAR